ncbi:dihydrodipicolinate synthase family protein [Martelella alba]|uniref:Dihydrodipicolinate synthase family protein n=1 Tax=Martelella alba TaxID=2590451 RepID=A0ABY2SK98_9HYPH|nr:dihydrodipicolinate synthase family protein [Martelella alba]TKI05512.1 dihydrodipicolinate synthase family protein [Martelella alba]
MSNLAQFSGVFPPVPTVVDEQGQLDKAGMAALIDDLIGKGVNGLLFLGSGGEFCHMTKEQRFAVAEFCVRHVARRVPVLLGISSSATTEAIEFGKHADSLGVDAVLTLNPYYARLTDQSIYRHFRQIAENVRTPIIIYNFPALTGQDITIAVLKRLAADVPGIIGIKDTVDNISHIREIINEIRPLRPDYVIFSGYDEYMLDNLILGGNGGIPATANFAPEITCGIYHAWRDKDYATLFALQRKLASLSTVYSLDTPFFGIVKQAIRLCGLDISTQVLTPALPADEEKTAGLITVLKRAGLRLTV